MNTISRTIVLRNESNAQSLWSLLKSNWRALADAGKPIAVTVQEHKAKRSLDQNKMFHGIVRQISEQAWMSGRKFDEDAWKEHLKREMLGTEEVVLPSGEIIARGISTASLNVSEFSEFLERVMVYAAQELGVELL